MAHRRTRGQPSRVPSEPSVQVQVGSSGSSTGANREHTPAPQPPPVATPPPTHTTTAAEQPLPQQFVTRQQFDELREQIAQLTRAFTGAHAAGSISGRVNHPPAPPAAQPRMAASNRPDVSMSGPRTRGNQALSQSVSVQHPRANQRPVPQAPQAPLPGRDARSFLDALRQERAQEAAPPAVPPPNPPQTALERQLAELTARLQQVEQEKAGPSRTAYTAVSALSEEIMRAPLPDNFKMPVLDSYNGTTDPEQHLDAFVSTTLFYPLSDSLICRAFPSTLRGAARTWFNNLPARSITSFSQLSNKFLTHFQASRVRKKTSYHLSTVKQQKDESLRDFIKRFNAEVLEIKEVDPAVHMSSLQAGVADGQLCWSLAKKPPKNLDDLLARCEKYAAADETSRPQ